MEATSNNLTVVFCPNCSKHSYNVDFCYTCKTRIPANSQRYHLKKKKQDRSSMVGTKNITTQQMLYQFEDMMNGNQSFHFLRGNVMFEPEIPCFTLTTDEEEPAPLNPMEGTSLHASQLFPIESEENLESDNPQYPEVMDVHPHLDEEEDPDKEIKYEEEDTFSDEESEEEEDEEENDVRLATNYPLFCRSVRIGSYRVYPPATSRYVDVILSEDSISFRAPVLTDVNRHVIINLRKEDILKILFHFGRTLLVMFVYTTAKFGDLVRQDLHMIPYVSPYFDPTNKANDTTQKLTFLIETFTKGQKTFIREFFPGEEKVKKIGPRRAHNMLVRSTPNRLPPSTLQYPYLQQHYPYLPYLK